MLNMLLLGVLGALLLLALSIAGLLLWLVRLALHLDPREIYDDKE